MKKLSRYIVPALIVAVIGLSLMGTTYTKTWVRTQITNWGPILSATHTFSGTVTGGSSVDTVLFPFTPTPITPGSTDTVFAVVILQTGPSVVNAAGDSTFVTWQLQVSPDNTHWTTAQQIAIDSAVTTTAIQGYTYYTTREFVIGIRGLSAQTWPGPYARIRAVGGNGAGIKNSPANLIKVTILR